ncbi:glycoside hydrolase family 95 protein [Frigoribacterium sp. ACAM 257]|nr:glycoside hydrolase family 95 protein [Frigoribacterium sp. ACAM 257]
MPTERSPDADVSRRGHVGVPLSEKHTDELRNPLPEHARHRIRLNSPATSFIESFLVGNGRFGAAVHGRPGCERFDLNLDTFWSGGPLSSAEKHDRSRWLEPIRAAVRRGDHEEAQRLAQDLQGDTWSQSYEPLGGLLVRFDDPSDESVFEGRELDMAAAIASSWSSGPRGPVRLRSWISAPRNVLVIELSGATHDVVLDLDDPHGAEYAASHENVPGASEALVHTWAGRAPVAVAPDYLGDVDEPIRRPTDEPDASGLVDAGMGFAIAAITQRTGPDEVRVIVAAVDGYRGRTARPSADLSDLRRRAVDQVVALWDVPTETMRAEHEAEHRSWFDRVDLDLSASSARDAGAHVDAAQAEQFFDLGRYLLIASSRPESQPANLQGIWNDDARPGWSCNWTTNINLPMNYWPAARLGLGELTAPFASLVADLAELASTTARDVYGAPGWALHHNTDLWGFSAPVPSTAPTDPHHANWPVAGLWLTEQLAELERFGVDLPVDLWAITAGAAEFALHLLEPDPDGRLVTNPSTSPEHDFLVDGVPFSVSAGTAMDQQLVADVFDTLLALVSEGRAPADTDAQDLTGRVRKSRDRLRPPRVGPDGALLEWGEAWEPADRGHRHLSHLYGLFPGASIDPERTPALEAAARLALRDRLDHGSGYTGWSQAWILCLAARIGDTDLVQHSVDILVRDLTSASLLDLHPVPNHPTGFRFQIDGNLGGVAGIIESLVSARDGHIRLLPALPGTWPAGSVRGLVVEGGHRVDLTWSEGRVERVRVTVGGDGEVRVSGPGVADVLRPARHGDTIDIPS